MTMVKLLSDTLSKTAIALVLSLLVVVAMTLVLLVLGYTRPNIRYQKRKHRERDYTFFIRNLDSVHYAQPMHVTVSGRGLKYVETEAGPWSTRRPVKIGEQDGRVQIQVIFDEVPEEAAFAIRARCVGDEPRIEIAHDSPLRPRAFQPMARFTFLSRLLHYSVRYVTGMVAFLVIFWGGLIFKYHLDGIETADKVTALVAAIVSGLSYALVVPLSGKRTIVGYVTSVETDQHWGDRGRSGGG